jgi:HEAT repeat protein
VLILLAVIQLNVYPKIYHFTLLEKTRGAEIILLAKCIKIQDEKYELEFPKIPEEKFKANRFAVYKKIEIWKGRYDKDTKTLYYKHTNEKYRPFICRPAVQPVIDEQVILFIEKDFAIFAGFQGKIQIDEEKIPLYRDAIKKFLELDTLSGRKKIFSTIKMIDDNNPYLRESMLRELHEIDNTTYGVEIANLLKHKNVSVRQSAISALIGTKKKEVVPLVIAALKDSDPRVRTDAVTVLWRIDDERITPALMKSFNDESAQVRKGVIFALSRRKSKESIPLYLKALRDVDPLVRAAGVNAFEWVHEPKVIPELLDALKDENERVRSSSVRTLYVYIRCNTIKPNNEIIKSITPLLTDKDGDVRKEAAYFMATVGWRGYRNMLSDAKIINKLLQIAEGDENYLVRASAIDALGLVATPRAIPILLKSLSDPQFQVRSSAATALANIGDKKVLPYLREALKKEKHDYVKEELKAAIKQLKK